MKRSIVLILGLTIFYLIYPPSNYSLRINLINRLYSLFLIESL